MLAEKSTEGYVYGAPATIEDAYFTCQHLIESTTRGFVRKHAPDLEYEDALAQANLIFVRAYQTYDPSKGSLGARICHEVWTYLFDYMRSKRCRSSRLQITDPITIDSTEPPASRFSLDKMLIDLSQDAKDVVLLALNTSQPKEKRPRPAQRIRELIAALAHQGWSGQRIVKAFKEIKQNLETI